MNYIPIRSYDNYVTANLQLALLQQAGIDCHLKDEYTVTIDPLLSPALGGMKLMVEEWDLQHAVELLKESDMLYLKSVRCPVCSQNTIEFVSETIEFSTWSGKIRSLLVNGQEQQEKRYYRCTTCFSQFSELPNAS